MLQIEPRFALNHMIAPQLDLGSFLALAQTLGVHEVEIRNDISDNAILDGTTAKTVQSTAQGSGIKIISINALQRFNDWNDEREVEAIALAVYARDCGAQGLVLVPTNDGTGRANGERQGNLRVALKSLKPILDDHGIVGYLECLGFEACSMRSKREAVDAIHAINGGNTFRIVHDTFHHHIAGEPDMFPEITGLVHISGVNEPNIGVSEMQDAHRGLVDGADRMGNLAQIAALYTAGYAGPFSLEPFAKELRTLADPAHAIGESIDFIKTQLVNQAA